MTARIKIYLTLLSLSSILLMEGCNMDRVFSIECWVRNELSENIILSVESFGTGSQANIVDTVFYVDGNDSLMIDLSNPAGRASDLFLEGGYILFDSIAITKEDGTTSPKDFAPREEWDYQRVNAESVIYTLVVDESDF